MKFHLFAAYTCNFISSAVICPILSSEVKSNGNKRNYIRICVWGKIPFLDWMRLKKKKSIIFAEYFCHISMNPVHLINGFDKWKESWKKVWIHGSLFFPLSPKACCTGLLASVLMLSAVVSSWELTGPERWALPAVCDTSSHLSEMIHWTVINLCVFPGHAATQPDEQPPNPSAGWQRPPAGVAVVFKWPGPWPSRCSSCRHVFMSRKSPAKFYEWMLRSSLPLIPVERLHYSAHYRLYHLIYFVFKSTVNRFPKCQHDRIYWCFFFSAAEGKAGFQCIATCQEITEM